MARVETVRCDGCGALKGESNHWWHLTVWETEYSVSLTSIACDGSLQPLRLDICSEKCLMTKEQEIRASFMAASRA